MIIYNRKAICIFLKKDIKFSKVSDKMFTLADDIMQITIIVN